ncbi:four helix bundle protein [bacterium]|nr:four helix bundle protein [bacterium]
MNADELENRLIEFAVRALRLGDALPKSPAGRHVQGQIVKCGTSPAPNYSEARGAESTADFVHKLRIVLKELNETKVWLLIIVRSAMLTPQRVGDLLDENVQLCKIIGQTIASASRRKRPVPDVKCQMPDDE